MCADIFQHLLKVYIIWDPWTNELMSVYVGLKGGGICGQTNINCLWLSTAMATSQKLL